MVDRPMKCARSAVSAGKRASPPARYSADIIFIEGACRNEQDDKAGIRKQAAHGPFRCFRSPPVKRPSFTTVAQAVASIRSDGRRPFAADHGRREPACHGGDANAPNYGSMISGIGQNNANLPTWRRANTFRGQSYRQRPDSEIRDANR